MQSTITAKSRDEWRADLEQIKSLGFNTARTWVEWTHTEPQEGKYDFKNLELLLELAQEVGLRVIIQMYGESAPDWVGKKYPDGLFEAHSGDKIIPQSAPGYCVDHPGVREAFSNFYTETAKIANQYDNFYGWDLWSEPHIVQWGSPRWITGAQYCFCPHTQARFRQWLKDKYQSLEELNRAWYRTFESWEDVEPPRFNTILSYTDFMDWKSFTYQKMAGDLGLRYASVRKVDKTHVATSHASPASIFSSPQGRGAEDDFLFAEQVDFYGISQYPKHNRPGEWTPWRFMTSGDFSYSANKNNNGYYVGEFQSGFGTVGLRISDEVTPENQRIWLWSSLATGAKAVNIYAYYPMSSGYESGGYGLINLDGTVTRRAVALGKHARTIDENKELFVTSKPVEAEIALVYNPLAQMVGGSRSESGVIGHSEALIGYYRVFADNNIPTRFIHRFDLEKEDLSRYKLIIVPYPIMFTRAAAEGLKAYVEQGGHVVAEARLAWNDERGYATEVIPGMGLSEVFGIRETKVVVRDSVMMKILDVSHPAMAQLAKGDLLKGALFAESVETLANSGARVLAALNDDTPCVVASRYGGGETLYIGSFLANHPAFDKNNTRFLLGLLDWAEIVRPFTSTHDGATDKQIVVRLHENPDGYLLYVLNQGKETQKTTVRLNVAVEGEYAFHEITQNRVSRVQSRNNTLILNTGDIAGEDVEVWSIKPVR
ncbi:beta-galactosidase [Candidatus Neomarinimicrobiota bacterium]